MNTSTTTQDAIQPLSRDASPRDRTPSRLAIRTLRRLEPIGQAGVLLALRLLYGGLFVQTGLGKLTHLARTAGFFESIGLPAPALMAALVGATELVGGVLLLAGLGTRFAAAALTTVMLTAFATAHASEAFQSIEKFMEQAPFSFLVSTVILLAFGAGRLSVDAWLGRRRLRPDRMQS